MTATKSRALRTFFALWPDPAVRGALADRAAAAARATGGKSPRPESLHLTLVFNGATMPDKAASLSAMMDAIRLPAFLLRFDRCGWFRHTGVAWLGTQSPPDPLLDLQHALARGATRIGFSLDVRPYVPHLTLARHAQRSPPPMIGALEWPVASFVLVASDLLPDGPHYRVLHETKLTMNEVAATGATPRIDVARGEAATPTENR